MKPRSLVLCLVLAALVLPVHALAQDQRDVRLADEVARQVRLYPQFTIFDDVRSQVDRGIVTLNGRVTQPYKKDEVGRRVAAIDGVRQLQNNIGVLPNSGSDEDLRYRTARAIYGHPSFWTYAAMANPPIHIIVERGRVTLTGIVSDNADRVLARSLAIGVGGVSVTNELRIEGEMASRQSAIYLSGGSNGLK